MYILSGWWFQICFKIFHNIWDNPSHWLIFFRGVGQPPTSYCIACVEAYQQFQLGAKLLLPQTFLTILEIVCRLHALSCPQIWILNGWFPLAICRCENWTDMVLWRNRPIFFYMFWFLGFQARTSSSNFVKSRSSTQQINVDIHGESASLWRRP